MLPSNLQERSRARQVMAWIRSDLMPIREERPTSSLCCGVPVKPLSPKAEDAARSLVAAAAALLPEDRLQMFSEWSIADADLALMLQRLNQHGYPLPSKLSSFAQAQWRRPFIKEWVEAGRPPYVPY